MTRYIKRRIIVGVPLVVAGILAIIFLPRIWAVSDATTQMRAAHDTTSQMSAAPGGTMLWQMESPEKSPM